MQVILRTNIENLGQLGDLVKVKPGYARNYLIPKKLAMQATASNLKAFEQQRKKLEAELEAQRSEAEKTAQRLQELELLIPVRVGEGDKLYGSVTNAHIAQALEDKGLSIDKKQIELEKPIRALGEYQIPVRVYPEVKPEVKVSVIRHDEAQGLEQQG
ncbi:MAG: 50S ribosomal protein L9 [Desulfohalobiaceae bacterium]